VNKPTIFDLVPAYNTLASNITDARFIELIWEQIKKDINFFGEYIQDINKPTLHDIYEQLINFLGNLHPSKLPEFLYRIDIPEIQMSSYTLNGFEEIALLILKREALKVYFRIRFAN
jgi:hypothetical protein